MTRTLSTILLLTLLATGCASRPVDCGRSRVGECRPGIGEQVLERSERQAASAVSSGVGQIIRRGMQSVIWGR